MKNEVNTSLHGHVDPLADEQYEQLKALLLATAEKQGQADGLDNLPVTESEFRIRFANTVFDQVQASLTEHALYSQNLTDVVLTKKKNQAALEKIRSIRKSLIDDEIRLDILNKESQRIMPNRWHNLRRTLTHAGLGVMAVSEGVLAQPAFRAIPLPTEYATIAACGVAVATLVGAHLGARLLRKANSKAHYWLWNSLIHAAALGFFYGLAGLRTRSRYPESITPLDSSETILQTGQPDCAAFWAICLTSFTLFCLGLYASIVYYKSNDEALREEVYKEKTEAIGSLSASINQRYQQISEIESQSTADKDQATAGFGYAIGHQARLIALGVRTLNLYAQRNTAFRSDGEYPECFIKLPQHEYTSVFTANYKPE